MIWLREYENFLNNSDLIDQFGIYSDSDDFSILNETIEYENNLENLLINNDKQKKHLTTCKLYKFLNQPYHDVWYSFLRLSNESLNKNNQNSTENCPKILRFIIKIVFNNTLMWKNRIKVITDSRKIVNDYKTELNATIYEENAMFIDQMLSLKTSMIQVNFNFF